MPITIVLIGMPGAGKSYWGQKLASALNIAFYDLDLLIEHAYEMPVAKFFAQYGETEFRKVEHNMLEEILTNSQQEPIVLACGGGTPAFHENIILIQRYAVSVFLDISIEQIIIHLKKDNESNRPLLSSFNTENLTAVLNHLRENRLPFYQKANYTLNSEDLNLQNLKKIYIDEKN